MNGILYSLFLFLSLDIELQEEELLVDGEEIFRCNFSNKKIEFCNLAYINAETAIIDRYLQILNSETNSEDFNTQQLPFLRWIINNVALEKNSVLLKLADYVKRMNRMTVGSILGYTPRRINDKFFVTVQGSEQLQINLFMQFVYHFCRF